MKKIFTLLIIFVCLIFLSGCYDGGEIIADDYTDYICYDNHLVSLKCYKNRGVGKRFEDDGDTEITAFYKKIVDESDEQFIVALRRASIPFLDSPTALILQNPNNYIDPFEDWSIEKIEVYYRRLKSPLPPSDDAWLAPTKSGVIATSDDNIICTEFTDFIKNSDVSDTTIQTDIPKTLLDDDYVFRIRVYFNESKNIVWDSSLDYLLDSQDIIIGIVGSEAPTLIDPGFGHDASTKEFKKLYAWLSDELIGFRNSLD